MVTVGDRLLNPFNIETVVRPINLQISDAVMNFQLAGMNISNMVREIVPLDTGSYDCSKEKTFW